MFFKIISLKKIISNQQKIKNQYLLKKVNLKNNQKQFLIINKNLEKI